MKRKILFAAISISICSLGLTLGFYYNKSQILYKQSICQTKYLLEYEKEKEKQIRLDNMSRSLIIAFSISKWEAKYYSIIFDDFSQAYDIPWEIYACVFRIESNFLTTLISKSGAKGIGQLLESTAKELCERLDIQYVNSQTLWNDLLNMILSCYYLSEGVCDSAYKDSSIDCKLIHGVRRYLGGPSYHINVKKNKQINNYVMDYKTTVWKEYNKLKFIYKGVVADDKKEIILFF